MTIKLYTDAPSSLDELIATLVELRDAGVGDASIKVAVATGDGSTVTLNVAKIECGRGVGSPSGPELAFVTDVIETPLHPAK